MRHDDFDDLSTPDQWGTSKPQRPAWDAPTMEVINATPHDLHLVLGFATITLPRSGIVARVTEQRVQVGWTNPIVDGVAFQVPVNRLDLGELTGLPDPQPGVCYVVSRMAAEAGRHRGDLLIVDETVRDDQGRIIGARSLASLIP